MRHSPLFATAAIVTLAIGIGATTAIFSTVNATLLRPLPYFHPEELVSVRTRLSGGRITTGLLSPLELTALGAHDLPIAQAAGFGQPFDATLISPDGTPTQVLLAGTDFWANLRINPIDVWHGIDVVARVPSGTRLERQRLGMTLMLVFGATALALAGVGIYGVIAYAVAEREADVRQRSEDSRRRYRRGRRGDDFVDRDSGVAGQPPRPRPRASVEVGHRCSRARLFDDAQADPRQ